MATIKIGNNVFSGCNIHEFNNKLIIDGKTVEIAETNKINITIDGDINVIDLTCCDKIVINGDVTNFRMTSGNVEINGDVRGSVQLTGGKIACKVIEGNATVVSGSINQ